MLVFCTAFFGVCSLLTTPAETIDGLFYLRFLTGVGLGGALPNAIAITTDLAPQRIRATTVMVMFCGFSIGAAAGGFMAAALMFRYGWPSVFVAGGIAPCVVAVLLLMFLPGDAPASDPEAGERRAGLALRALLQSGRAGITSSSGPSSS